MSRYNKIMALAHEISPSSPAVLVDMHNKILDDAAHICEKSRDAIASVPRRGRAIGATPRAVLRWGATSTYCARCPARCCPETGAVSAI